MSPVRRLSAVMIAIVAAFAAASALAATTKVDDPTGDVNGSPAGSTSKSDVDITKATAGVDGARVKLTVHVKGSIDAALKHPETSPAFLLKKPGQQVNFDVYGSAKTGYTAGNFEGDTTTAHLGQPNAHTAAITFNPTPIGLSNKYRWQALMGLCAPFDQAPNKGWADGQLSKRC